MPSPVPLQFYLRRRRVRRAAVWISTLAVVAGLSWADHRGWFDPFGPGVGDLAARPWRLLAVAPGARLQVAPYEGEGPTRWVRLVGVTTACGPDADIATEALALDRIRQRLALLPIRLREVGAATRPPAVLAWDGDGVLLNEALLLAGDGCATPAPRHRRHARYRLLEQQAQRDGAGVWAPGTSVAGVSP